MTESRDYPARPILAASAAVFRPDGRLLLGARRLPPFDKVFSLPGGLVETGESLGEAALREVEEETGVKAEIVGFNDWREVIARDEDGRVKRHYVIASFAARWVSGEGAASEELGQVIWADQPLISTLELTGGLADIIARARAMLGFSA
ncbi:MAG: NUDIX hydrolase [Beijerinckiaceae bacterium]